MELPKDSLDGKQLIRPKIRNYPTSILVVVLIFDDVTGVFAPSNSCLGIQSRCDYCDTGNNN